MIYNQLLAESQRLETQINFINKQLQELPKGNFYCTNNGKHYKWYLKDGKNKIYIPKEKLSLAQEHAYKKYLTLQLKDLLQEKHAVDLYLKNCLADAPPSTQQLLDHPEYQRLLSSYINPLSKELSVWMNSPYEKNQKYPEKLIYKTPFGNLLRSKSELLIALCLETNQIPYRYENALHLDEIVIYPDFTIRHPITGKTFYWEHFGLMDQPDYFKNVYNKLHLYNTHGIVSSIQLIATYETRDYPLDVAKINNIIREYFLSP